GPSTLNILPRCDAHRGCGASGVRSPPGSNPATFAPSWACAYNPATSSCTIARRSFLALAFLVAGTIARAFDIGECGQSVPDGQVGDLRADLVCPVNPSVGVYMAAGGTLNLNGYSITGPGTALGGGVQCSGAEGRGACTVN